MSEVTDVIGVGFILCVCLVFILTVVGVCINSFFSIFGYELTIWQTLATLILFVCACPMKVKQ